ncbi:DUF2254 domain-containing protein [Mangrovibacter plantisponsor]|uniref:Putative membrane protein n=1 Tax=Mangrovibacter plantisponsor TaxID=451513 RepID=A0A317PZW9_9ENTR|nr:DUF2254 domain-containing protein [Mangrovibacter plantisponsor]PWW08170.1 putative membrane protein [Mangrovibacter plantisponsor]
MISRWQFVLTQMFHKLWFRATLFAIAAILTALISIAVKSFIPPAFSGVVGAKAVDNILNILASSMLAVTTFSLSIVVTAYGSATTNVTPRATRLVVEDTTTQNVLATFIGSFLFSLVGIIALNMGAYGERGRVILFVVTLVVIALIVLTLLRWIQHLTSLGRVGETTARVEDAALRAFQARAQSPCLGCFPWTESGAQPEGTQAIYSPQVGYVEHIDIGKLAAVLTGSPAHVYLVAQPGNFVHPSQAVMYTTEKCSDELRLRLLSALSISDARSFHQDPRFCLCVMAEIACRALSPAVNDPGTAIDVIGRAVRVLSVWAEQSEKSDQHAQVLYPQIHLAPLSPANLFDDIFSPVARDGAAMREVQLRLLKSLAMLAKAWPERYASVARKHAEEVMNHVTRAGHIQPDLVLLRSTFDTLFAGQLAKDEKTSTTRL